MPRRRKAYSRSSVLEEEEEAMEEEAAAEDEDDDVEDGDEDGEDDDDEGGGKGGRGHGRERPVQRNAANARERARMRVLSRAFCRLKTTLPWVPPDTKLSKLDTLRLATSYIAHLRAMLAAEAESVAAVETTAKGAPVGEEIPDRGRVSSLHPLNLTWPFSFQRSTSSSSSSPASSTSSNVSASLTSAQTGIASLGDEWSSVHGMQANHYCQDNHMAMDTRGPQNCVSPPSHHHILHHHHPHHFLPSSYPDSSLLHIA